MTSDPVSLPFIQEEWWQKCDKNNKQFILWCCHLKRSFLWLLLCDLDKNVQDVTWPMNATVTYFPIRSHPLGCSSKNLKRKSRISTEGPNKKPNESILPGVKVSLPLLTWDLLIICQTLKILSVMSCLCLFIYEENRWNRALRPWMSLKLLETLTANWTGVELQLHCHHRSPVICENNGRL